MLAGTLFALFGASAVVTPPPPAIHLWVPVSASAAGMSQVHQRCSAFVMESPTPGSAWVLTAGHCVQGKGEEYLLLHDFQGSLDIGFDFKHITRFAYGSFRQLDGPEDLAWRLMPKDKLKHTATLTPATHPPALGDNLYVTGFPHATGPYTQSCVFEGAKLVEENDVLRMKAQLSCAVDEDSQNLGGLSGAPVTNAQGQVVGVFTSRGLEGKHPSAPRAIYGFDPIVPGFGYQALPGTPVARLTDGPHRLNNRLSGSVDGSQFLITIQAGHLVKEVVHQTAAGEVLATVGVPGS